MPNFTGRVAVITGAASGIGRALAVNLAGRGAQLALSDVAAAGVAETAQLARTAGAQQVHEAQLDVSDREAFAGYARQVAEHFGRVNLVINNAGVSLTGPITDLTYDDLEWIFKINVWGVVHGTKEFLPHLINSGAGHLVNISSMFGLVTLRGQSGYAATKFAVRGFTEAVLEDLVAAKLPVAVTCVHPGGVHTSIARNSRVSSKINKDKLVHNFENHLARLSPERAAKIIVNGISKKKPRVVLGFDAHLLHNFHRFTGSRSLARWFGRS